MDDDDKRASALATFVTGMLQEELFQTGCPPVYPLGVRIMDPPPVEVGVRSAARVVTYRLARLCEPLYVRFGEWWRAREEAMRWLVDGHDFVVTLEAEYRYERFDGNHFDNRHAWRIAKFTHGKCMAAARRAGCTRCQMDRKRILFDVVDRGRTSKLPHYIIWKHDQVCCPM